MDKPENPFRVWSQGERAAALSLALADRLTGEQFPHARKVGRYLFFAMCAFGMAMVVAVLVRSTGANRDLSLLGANAAFIVAFLVLRDMSKTWDLAIYAAAETQKFTDDAMLAERKRQP